MARRGAETLDRAVSERWHLPLDRRQNVLPQRECLLPPARHRLGGIFEKWHRDRDLERTPIRHPPQHRCGCQLGIIVHRIPWRHLTSCEKFHHAAFLKCCRPMRIWAAVRDHTPLVHTDLAVVTADLPDRAASAEIAECLPRRIHLKWPHRHCQSHVLPGSVIHLIGRPQHQPIARTLHPREYHQSHPI